MTPGESTQALSSAALAAFRADFPVKAPNARSLAASIENPSCTARRVLDAAGVDKAALASRIAPRAEKESPSLP